MRDFIQDVASFLAMATFLYAASLYLAHFAPGL